MTRTDGRYVVDSDDRIITVVGHFEETLASFLGHSLWEVSPQAARLFAPHFAEARRTGCEVEFTSFYAGLLARRRVVPTRQTLTVHVTPLEELDVRTLATLSESLRRIEAELAARVPEQLDRRAPSSLRALP